MADTAAGSGGLLETTKANATAAFNTVANGPVAQNVKDETAKASGELSNLAASRRTPVTPAATGQPLTHYHSFFYELLSWKNPRASAIALTSTLTFILAVRYVNIIRWVLRLTWMALGVTVAAEATGKFVLNTGLASQLRPRRYYTVSRDAIDGIIGDFHELLNFIVIESQRILFVENVFASTAAAIGAFISFHLTKLIPYWGLAIIGTVIAFIAPLIYVSNQELIDEQLKNVSDIVNAQTAQVRNVVQEQTSQVASLGKQYAGDYTGKVQDMLRGSSGAPSMAPPKAEKKPEFPSAPTDEPVKTEFPSVPEEPLGREKENPLES